jgi:hypothetical protein
VHTPCFGDQEKKKKNLVNKNQGWEPSIKSTRHMRTQEDTTQRQIKRKQSTTPCFGDQEEKKKPCKYKSRIGTHPSKVQSKQEHKWTQPQEKTKANNLKKKEKNLCK